MTSDSEIWRAVEDLRERFPVLRPDKLPLDLMRSAFDVSFGRHAWVNDDALRAKAAEQIAPRFGVHRTAIVTRFDREGIWPSPY